MAKAKDFKFSFPTDGRELADMIALRKNEVQMLMLWADNLKVMDPEQFQAYSETVEERKGVKALPVPDSNVSVYVPEVMALPESTEKKINKDTFQGRAWDGILQVLKQGPMKNAEMRDELNIPAERAAYFSTIVTKVKNAGLIKKAGGLRWELV